MLDATPRVLTRADGRNARDDRVSREGGDDRPLDVEAVLQERDGRVARGDSRRDHISHQGRDVGDILGSDHHKVKRGQILPRDVGYAVAN